MVKFHISDDGNPRACKAQVGKCPIGEEAPHFETKENARAYYEDSQGDVFVAPKRTTQQTRFESMPAVKGVSYEIDHYGEDVNDEGVPYTSVDAFRDKKNGERARIASVTVYDDGTALVFDHGESDIPNIKARRKLAEALDEKYVISSISSETFRLPPKAKPAAELDSYGHVTREKNSDEIARTPGSEMNREEVQKYSFSIVSHNMNPMIGQLRLAATDETDPSGEVSRVMEKGEGLYIDTAVKDVAAKLDGDPATVSKFLKDSLVKKMTPLLEGYAKDPWKSVDPTPAFREWSDDVAKYSRKK